MLYLKFGYPNDVGQRLRGRVSSRGVTMTRRLGGGIFPTTPSVTDPPTPLQFLKTPRQTPDFVIFKLINFYTFFKKLSWGCPTHHTPPPMPTPLVSRQGRGPYLRHHAVSFFTVFAAPLFFLSAKLSRFLCRYASAFSGSAIIRRMCCRAVFED